MVGAAEFVSFVPRKKSAIVRTGGAWSLNAGLIEPERHHVVVDAIARALLLVEEPVAAAHHRLLAERLPGEAEARAELRPVRPGDRERAGRPGCWSGWRSGRAHRPTAPANCASRSGASLSLADDDRARRARLEGADLAAVAGEPRRILVAQARALMVSRLETLKSSWT